MSAPLMSSAIPASPKSVTQGCPRSEIETALNNLREKELIETHGLQMIIHDLAGLRTIADQ